MRIKSISPIRKEGKFIPRKIKLLFFDIFKLTFSLFEMKRMFGLVHRLLFFPCSIIIRANPCVCYLTLIGIVAMASSVFFNKTALFPDFDDNQHMILCQVWFLSCLRHLQFFCDFISLFFKLICPCVVVNFRSKLESRVRFLIITIIHISIICTVHQA